ncbi:MAG: tRNA uridine-5-carboxymethylaminomethyl(34) synthesis GTPase MnmE [Clostridia bacterium]|nr:tRNA uridine-5-carboxymethylaminomethyl(34) synthesis GTPase MnmE [Clostridia bacterium]
MDTIFAPATPSGGALCVLRVSGPDSRRVLREAFSAKDMQPRFMTYGRLLGAAGETLDVCMAVFFASPHSYTGEDMAEFYLHGGQAVVKRALARMTALGLRIANPGEFTQRAFLNGKTDLSRAEAVMDVINATAGRAADAAVEQLAGGLQKRITDVEAALRAVLAALDAAIDYPEEVEEDVTAALPAALQRAAADIRALAENGVKNRVLREGAKVVIIGAPNVGKSSLLNALLQEEHAIVTDVAGTTRDVLQFDADFDGVPVRLYDTAGLHESVDAVERIGIERAWKQAEKADLLLVALDASRALRAEEEALLKSLGKRPYLLVLCKADLPEVLSLFEGTLPRYASRARALSVSAVTGEGIGYLRSVIAQLVCPESEALVTNARHIALLQRALAAVEQAKAAADMDCAATDIREALLHLGGITGSIVDDAVIEEIFRTFCVGK